MPLEEPGLEILWALSSALCGEILSPLRTKHLLTFHSECAHLLIKAMPWASSASISLGQHRCEGSMTVL